VKIIDILYKGIVLEAIHLSFYSHSKLIIGFCIWNLSTTFTLEYISLINNVVMNGMSRFLIKLSK